MDGKFCGAQWPNLGPAGGCWICTLDAGHDGWHQAEVGNGVSAADPSAEIPQGHPDILGAEL